MSSLFVLSDGVEKGRGCEVAGRAKAGLIYNSIDLLHQIVETFDYLDQHNNNKQIKGPYIHFLKPVSGRL